MPCKPARKITMLYPNPFQTLIRMRAGMAQV
jgi:hypothetical protein